MRFPFRTVGAKGPSTRAGGAKGAGRCRFDAPVADVAEAIQALCYPRTPYGSNNIRRGHLSVIRLLNLAYHMGSRRVLEIGVGLSTVGWARFARATGACVSAVDMNVDRTRSIIEETGEWDVIRENVELIEAVTTDTQELVEFYTGGPMDTYAGMPTKEFMAELDLFKRERRSPRWRAVCRLMGSESWQPSDILFRDGALFFPRELLDLFSVGTSFERDVDVLRTSQSAGMPVLDRVVPADQMWDLVFFDSGELASALEWRKLKDRIVIGGIAAFHDIFFPASLKNCVVCASVCADEGWEVVYMDESTKQGLLIARRVC